MSHDWQFDFFEDGSGNRPPTLNTDNISSSEASEKDGNSSMGMSFELVEREEDSMMPCFGVPEGMSFVSNTDLCPPAPDSTISAETASVVAVSLNPHRPALPAPVHGVAPALTKAALDKLNQHDDELDMQSRPRLCPLRQICRVKGNHDQNNLTENGQSRPGGLTEDNPSSRSLTSDRPWLSHPSEDLHGIGAAFEDSNLTMSVMNESLSESFETAPYE